MTARRMSIDQALYYPAATHGLRRVQTHGRVAMYNRAMAKDVIRISEVEAARDFADLIKRVRAGAEIIIENGERPVAVLHPADPARRGVSECIALAEKHEQETGRAPVLDADFAKDMEEILSRRKPWNPLPWE